MNKGGLVTEVARRTDMSKADVAAVVDSAMTVIKDKVAKEAADARALLQEKAKVLSVDICEKVLGRSL